ncbi:KRI1-like family C-terminal-domain-containing protein [Rhodocollybia butyracea]|uniref:KRI1-like family C-terminal-domain-containing protein n=1 Tax=Rhodocollybia butyracea TaxID=206335 RepID=A0A9P5Q2D7_9AGAR|nr:KRI1-like family C-terminal-domain-containing protein [Rhodocollybia butyracea]
MQKKREEVKRLKALKMKELRVKLDRISKQGGKSVQDDTALQQLDLEGEWDPEAHDRQMTDLYGDDAEYDEDAGYGDDDKPTWDDDIDIDDIVNEAESDSKSKKKKKKKKAKDATEDEGVDVNAMDAEVERVDDDEEWDGTEEMRKRKVEEYMDEVYGLDFNDMVGGMPTRFQYARIHPESFHLTPAEILMATDADLNEYIGIKKFAPYRKSGNWDANRGDRLKELKRKIGERGHTRDTVQEDKPVKKRKGKKERMRNKMPVDPGATIEDRDEAEDSRNLKRKRSTSGMQEAEATSPKKRNRRHKKKDNDIDV